MVRPVVASTSLESLECQAREKRLANHPYWHRLLHYSRNLLGIYESEIDDPFFFTSPRGRRDPQAELDATLAAFFQTSSPAAVGGGRHTSGVRQLSGGSMDSLPATAGNDAAQAAQCRYPARYVWLKDELEIDPAALPSPACRRYEKWKKELYPEAVSLVFASSYMNNPSSTYGHTFLLLKKKGQGGDELLDYAVNFAADLENDNGFLYAVKGLMGGYRGRFSTFPYYMKVQEYNNLESRDLWEYDLRLSKPSIERLMQHLWELGNVRIRYFFLNKNCSYYLMPLLEVAEPYRNFKKEFVLKTVPVDTIRTILRQPGFSAEVSRRPSHASKMITKRARLTSLEILLAEQFSVIPAVVGGPSTRPAGPSARFVEDGNPSSMLDPRQRHSGVTALQKLAPERQAMVLDSAYDLFRYRVGFIRQQSPAVQEKEHDLLLARNQVGGVKTSFPAVPGVPQRSLLRDSPLFGDGESIVDGGPPTAALGGDGIVAPHLGHNTGRLGLAYGFSNHSHFEEFSARAAAHDQEDPPEGYLPGSRLEMFDLKLRYDNDRNTLYLEEFALVDLLSLTPWDRWIHPPSWKVNTGLAVANDLNRDPENSLYYGLNLGTGYAARAPGMDKILVYAMAEMELELGHAFDHSIRFGGGPSGGLLFNPAKFWRARLAVSHFPYVVAGTPSTTKLGFYQSFALTKDFELRAKLERQNTYKEVLLSGVWFL